MSGERKSATRARARLLILSHLAQFGFSINFGDGVVSPGYHKFLNSKTPSPGALVAMQAAPPSKWYLSWVVEVNPGPYGHQYLLESIEDGALGNWQNIGIIEYDPNVVADHPEWRWTDAQHALNDRWMRVARKHRCGYMRPPRQLEFGTDRSVTLRKRVRITFPDGVENSKAFEDWRKLTIADMTQFCDEDEAEHGK